MKDSKVRAKQAAAAQSAAQDVADLHRKVDLILVHLKINAASNPEADALVDARAAAAAGEATKEQEALLQAELPAQPASTSVDSSAEATEAESKKRAYIRRR